MTPYHPLWGCPHTCRLPPIPVSLPPFPTYTVAPHVLSPNCVLQTVTRIQIPKYLLDLISCLPQEKFDKGPTQSLLNDHRENPWEIIQSYQLARHKCLIVVPEGGGVGKTSINIGND